MERISLFIFHSDLSSIALYSRVQLCLVIALHRCLIYQLRSQHPKVGSSYADRIFFSHDCQLKVFFKTIWIS